MRNQKFKIRNVLLSSGEFTTEVVIIAKDGKEIYESSPEGLTVGLKEAKKTKISNKEIEKKLFKLYVDDLTQKEFDIKISKKFGANISTPLSLAYIRYLSYKEGYNPIISTSL